ncbi:thioesterase family protein [Terasakiella sp. A23]|uniref:acyl-CoA thioesterase n=1 Tax=Terasakiella sp. FCG-A23 TaxID=3080561 RepID=UPI002953694F|nr:thioesterase family protein [Terasakiella sp. A23]MDV7338521.1 thioesterase family protein [Terasakiella sp. A23]
MTDLIHPKSIVTHRSVVQQWECDHMGHLNVRHYMAKFDDAAWNLLAELGINKKYFSERNGGVAAVDHHVTYKKEMVAGDSVTVRTHLALFEGKKFKMIHRMFDSITGDLVADCELFGVHMDQTARRASEIPKDILAKGQAFLGETKKAAE